MNVCVKNLINFKFITPAAKEAFIDIYNGTKNWSLWYSMAITELKRRYKRTLIGPFWTTLSLSLYIFSMSIVFSYLWKTDIRTFLPYFTSGIICWNLLSTIITEGCSVFVNAEGLLKQVSLPYSIFPCLVVARNILVLSHHMLLYIIVAIILKVSINYNILLFFLGLCFVIISGVSISFIMGIICARYRDILPIVGVLLQSLMFVTPIFWKNNQMAGIRFTTFVKCNPLYHYINIIRAPLLGETPALLSWIVLFCTTLLFVMIAFYVFAKYRRKIIFWI